MAGDNNFLQFDPNLTNIIDDATYLASNYRLNGAVSGIAPSNQHNKLFYQLSTMVSAIAQAYANHNIDISDANFATLVSTLEKGLLVNFWKPSAVYAGGDVCYSSVTDSYKRFECTVAGTSGSTEPAWGAVGTTIADGTATWKVYDIRQGTSIGRIPGLIDVGGGKAGLPAVSGKLLTDISGVSIGTVLPFLATKAQPGWLAVDSGALVSRDTYSELWAWVQTDGPLITEAAWQAQAAVQTSVGAYSSGDGSTTFRLPRIVDYVRGGLTADVGTWQGDAIRNITGTFRTLIGNPTGVFSATSAGTSSMGGVSGAAYDSNLTFDASKVVPTADENRPKTIKMLYCVKAFDAVTNQGLIDITALANEMASKVNSSDFTGTNQSKTANGWQKLHGGLIFQWGITASTVDFTDGVNTTITFPIAFPNTALAAYPTIQLATPITGGLSCVYLKSAPTNTGFVAESDSVTTAGNGKIIWFAIGY